MINQSPDNTQNRESTTVSYDEKPGIQAIKNIAAQLRPVPGKYSTIGRDYEYKRLGTVSLLGGIDLQEPVLFMRWSETVIGDYAILLSFLN